MTTPSEPTPTDPITRFQELSNHAGNPGAPTGRGTLHELDRSLRQAQAAIEAAMDAARALLWQHGASDPGSGPEQRSPGLDSPSGTQGPGEAHTATQRPVSDERYERVVADVIALADSLEGTPAGELLEAAGRAMLDDHPTPTTESH
jgi:hypothetical protein